MYNCNYNMISGFERIIWSVQCT